MPSRGLWPSSIKSIAAGLAMAVGVFAAFGRRRKAVADSEGPKPEAA